MRVASLIVAAGRGQRARMAPGTGGAETPDIPKQYRSVGGRPLLARSISAFLGHQAVDDVLVVIYDADRDLYDAVAAPFGDRLHGPVSGGAQRQASVRAGLEALRASAPDKVLIHDAVRPFVDEALIGRVIEGLNSHAAALPCMPVTDTLKRAKNGIITETVNRSGIWRAQTPQGFDFNSILQAHQAAAESGLDFTDDASIAEWYGLAVAKVEGAENNRKITTNEDFVMAEAMLNGTNPMAGIRVGTGYDVHATEPGDGVILAGVTIPHTMRLVGHSDADVVLHALTDALLGAIADGDIGVHFPPSDERWRGADSSVFVAEALRRVKERGGDVLHVDTTLLCEAPKIGPYRDAMRRRIAELLGLALDQVGLKATTLEGLGALGKKEGIAAMATVTVRLD